MGITLGQGHALGAHIGQGGSLVHHVINASLCMVGGLVVCTHVSIWLAGPESDMWCIWRVAGKISAQLMWLMWLSGSCGDSGVSGGGEGPVNPYYD